jgi:transposase-like protein
MYVMPKKIDPKVKERCIQQMLEHVAEYPNPTAAAEVLAKRNGVGTETVRRWFIQTQVDSGQRKGATSEEIAEIKELKAKVNQTGGSPQGSERGIAWACRGSPIR